MFIFNLIILFPILNLVHCASINKSDEGTLIFLNVVCLNIHTVFQLLLLNNVCVFRFLDMEPEQLIRFILTIRIKMKHFIHTGWVL